MSVPLAEDALAAWGGASGVQLIAERENAVFRARLARGDEVALRIHRRGYRSVAAIEAELALTKRVVAQGVACPAPIRTLDGGWVSTTRDGRPASVVAWVSGQAIVPTPESFHRLGQAIGNFHSAVDTVELPARLPRWDGPALLGETPTWGKFWESPVLSPDERRALENARDRLRVWLQALPEPDIGVIHGDLLPDNVLVDGERLTLIDFDDCGVGFRGFDLATALIAHEAHPDYPLLTASLLAGHASVRGSANDFGAELPRFLLTRALASCGWAASRTSDGDPLRRVYADRALRLARNLPFCVGR